MKIRISIREHRHVNVDTCTWCYKHFEHTSNSRTGDLSIVWCSAPCKEEMEKCLGKELGPPYDYMKIAKLGDKYNIHKYDKRTSI